MSPLLGCLERVSAALRQRRALRTRAEEAADGTLEGVAAEVQALVGAELQRAADLGGVPHGVAQHVLARLQQEVEVGAVGELLLLSAAECC